nr:hypothetical protein TetV2_00117 [Oceanusvirus sp.]
MAPKDILVRFLGSRAKASMSVPQLLDIIQKDRTLIDAALRADLVAQVGRARWLGHLADILLSAAVSDISLDDAVNDAVNADASIRKKHKEAFASLDVTKASEACALRETWVDENDEHLFAAFLDAFHLDVCIDEDDEDDLDLDEDDEDKLDFLYRFGTPEDQAYQSDCDLDSHDGDDEVDTEMDDRELAELVRDALIQ